MTPIQAARESKARRLASTIASAVQAGKFTVRDVRLRDTELFWALAVQESGVNGPSHPEPSGIYKHVSRETRDLVLELLEILCKEPKR